MAACAKIASEASSSKSNAMFSSLPKPRALWSPLISCWWQCNSSSGTINSGPTLRREAVRNRALDTGTICRCRLTQQGTLKIWGLEHNVRLVGQINGLGGPALVDMALDTETSPISCFPRLWTLGSPVIIDCPPKLEHNSIAQPRTAGISVANESKMDDDDWPRDAAGLVGEDWCLGAGAGSNWPR